MNKNCVFDYNNVRYYTRVFYNIKFVGLFTLRWNCDSNLHLMIVDGPGPKKALFKEFVAPPLQLWFDDSSRFLGHIGQHFNLLSVTQPGQ